jgi:P27 family predicted phage terminase small subunit
MSKGRKPKPTALKILHGTDQPSRMNPNEPKPSSDKVKMPDCLSPEAQECWEQVAQHLSDAGVLTNLDIHALTLYCEAYARWKTANDMVVRYGTVIKTKNGNAVQSPYLAIANKGFDQLTKMMSEFGMTPSSRTRVSVADAVSSSDPLEEFFRRKANK